MSRNDYAVLMTLRDTGVGLSADLDIENLVTLALRLAGNLAAQLNGKVTFERNGGTGVTIEIPVQND